MVVMAINNRIRWIDRGVIRSCAIPTVVGEGSAADPTVASVVYERPVTSTMQPAHRAIDWACFIPLSSSFGA